MVSSFVERCDISGVFGERVRRRAVAGGPRCRRCTGPRAMAGAAALVMLGSAAGAVTIETVPVGNPGNAAQATYGFGAVAYSYQIGKFEVTAGQYTEFLNAVAASDPNLLYDTRMSTSSYGCKIIRDGDPGSYTYSIAPDWANRPVNLVSWASAARFVNWLHNGQPTGPQSLSTTEDGSYFLNGAFTNTELAAVVRKSDATWVIPTIDEWYKAAYHYNDGVTAHYYLYPTGSDTAPSNVLADPDPATARRTS